MIKKRWIVRPDGNSEKVDHLASVLNVDKKIANLLIQRGIETYDEAKVYFRPELSDLHDPFLMKDMDKAVERLDKALKKTESI